MAKMYAEQQDEIKVTRRRNLQAQEGHREAARNTRA